MFPLRDENPLRITPVVTRGLIALNVGVFVYELALGDALPGFVRTFALVPSRFELAVHGVAPFHSAALPLDYLGVSPVFATPTKTDTAAPWGLDGLRRLRATTDLPLVAIGGIQLHNAAQVMRAGADSLAVVSAICSADDPFAASQQLRELIDAH